MHTIEHGGYSGPKKCTQLNMVDRVVQRNAHN